ncbi:MAG: type I methionyl aminopeptidase [Spirochaetia bacterium]|nr:type I methionyl aminopeptidase [Spirochaetia bacterium]
MAVRIYANSEIVKIQKAGEIAYNAHMHLVKYLKAGVSTLQLNDAANEYIESRGASAAFFGFHGYPAHICTSVNDVVVHGIPGKDVILKDGDIIGIDIGVKYQDYYADTAWTWPIGNVSNENKKLIEYTQKSLFQGIKAAVAGNRVGAIGASVQEVAEKNGFSVVRSLVGHGVGKSIHEEPQVPNFGRKKDGVILKNGMVLAIEPMINAGTYDVLTDKDQWTVRTRDGKCSAHFEHTIAITSEGPKICTLPERSETNVFMIIEQK